MEYRVFELVFVSNGKGYGITHVGTTLSRLKISLILPPRFFISASVYDATLLLTRCITYERLSNRTTSTRGSARSMPHYKHNKNKATSLRIISRARPALESCQGESFSIHCQSIVCYREML